MLAHGTSNRRSAPRLKSNTSSKQRNFAFNQPTTKKSAQIKLDRISSQFHKKFTSSNSTLNATSEILQSVNEEIGWKPLLLLFICIMAILCIIVFLFLPSNTEDNTVINLHKQHDINHPSHMKNIHDINSHLNQDSKFETGLGVDPEGYYNSFPHHSSKDEENIDTADDMGHSKTNMHSDTADDDIHTKRHARGRTNHKIKHHHRKKKKTKKRHRKRGQHSNEHGNKREVRLGKEHPQRRRIIDHKKGSKEKTKHRKQRKKRRGEGLIEDEMHMRGIEDGMNRNELKQHRVKHQKRRRKHKRKKTHDQFGNEVEDEITHADQKRKRYLEKNRKHDISQKHPPPQIITDDKHKKQKLLKDIKRKENAIHVNVEKIAQIMVEKEKTMSDTKIDTGIKVIDAEVNEAADDGFRVGLEWKDKKKFQEHWKIIQNVDITPSLPLENEEETMKKAYAVKHAFLHAWHGYAKYAMGHDEIHPDSHLPGDSWGGLGATLIDALDTMMIMGIKEEFKAARQKLDTIDFDVDLRVSFFETTIRHLGGLLGAYEMSIVLGKRDKILKKKMIELADRLLPAFETFTGVPKSLVNLQTKELKNYDWTRGHSVLSEVGSNQLEMYAMSHYTHNPKYFIKSAKIYEMLESARGDAKLYPRLIETNTGKFARKEKVYSFGGMSDSFYEYLLKTWIVTGYEDERAIRMYVDAMDYANEELLFKVVDEKRRPEPFWFYGELWYGKFRGNMEELTCFVPGLLALGSYHANIRLKQSQMKHGIPLTKAEKKLIEMKEQHLKLAHVLVESCYQMYNEMETGLAPESITFTDTEWKPKEMRYQLRPETLESLYILYSVTGNQIYRDWAWNIFESIKKHCKTDVAYSGIIDVSEVPAKQNNEMESYVMAETFKYLFLMYDTYAQEMLPLSLYVFNTEAHPIRQFDVKGEYWYGQLFEGEDEDDDDYHVDEDEDEDVSEGEYDESETDNVQQSL